MTFLKAYCDYAGRQTDAPPLFHLYVGLGVLAAALGNLCWVRAWGRRICPNLWLILLAPSGLFRKTTAINIGQSILSQCLPDLIWPSDWSYEALLGTMAGKPAGSLWIGEYRRFDQALRRDYAGGSKEALVDSYDNPELQVRRTRMGGDVKVQFPAPTLVAATTQDWFNIAQDDLGGGFLSRMFVIAAQERGEWRGLGAMPSDADRHQRDSLMSHLKRANANMRGQLDYAQIKERFNEWLRRHEDSWASRCSPDLAGTVARSGANALKLTMIFQADAEPSTNLSPEAFEKAHQMVEDLNQRMGDLLAEGLTLSPEARERKRVAETIRAAFPEPVDRSTLLRNLHLSAWKLDRHVETLVQAGEVAFETTRSAGRPGKAYKWVNGAKP